MVGSPAWDGPFLTSETTFAIINLLKLDETRKRFIAFDNTAATYQIVLAGQQNVQPEVRRLPWLPPYLLGRNCLLLEA